MSKRLQVVLDEAEFDEITVAARRQRLTVGEWVLQSLRRACAEEGAADTRAKLDVLRMAMENAFPTGDIDEMLSWGEREQSASRVVTPLLKR